ncbi:hypothetical protein C0Q70_14920 [Pomacea canaliculata]|uniref:Uncharacterized protein n=1 Tax=Pomacea canaliculata TaxID=400727 RepID=A0A2T7NTD3_POMCA|nr:hypothetical protein C0Q70_14920 [Pomacea canaliculata]
MTPLAMPSSCCGQSKPSSRCSQEQVSKEHHELPHLPAYFKLQFRTCRACALRHGCSSKQLVEAAGNGLTVNSSAFIENKQMIPTPSSPPAPFHSPDVVRVRTHSSTVWAEVNEGSQEATRAVGEEAESGVLQSIDAQELAVCCPQLHEADQEVCEGESAAAVAVAVASVAHARRRR